MSFSNFGFQRAGAQPWDPLPHCSSLTVNSDEYLECYVRHTAGTGSSLQISSSVIIESVLIQTSYIYTCSVPPCWNSSPGSSPRLQTPSAWSRGISAVADAGAHAQGRIAVTIENTGIAKITFPPPPYKGLKKMLMPLLVFHDNTSFLRRLAP